MKCIVVDPLQKSHPCHRFCNCNETFTSCSLLDLCRIHCACHPKPRPNVQMWSEAVSFNALDLRMRALLNSSIAKSAQSAWNLKRFKVFDFETCFFEICFPSQTAWRFLRSTTSKSVPRLRCFAPRTLAIFDLSPRPMAPHRHP